jgi:hypothetical protein
MEQGTQTTAGEIVDLVTRIDIGGSAVDGWKEVLAACHRVASWVEGRRLAAVAALSEVPSVFPQQVVADVGRVSLQQGGRVVERAATVTAMPAVGIGLQAGSLTTAHVDVLSGGWRVLDTAGKAALAAQEEVLVRSAGHMSVGEFRRLVNDRVRRLQADDGVDELARQRRNVRMNMWHDRSSHMWHGQFQLDAETGSRLHGRLQRAVETLFHGREPEECPKDPLEKQRFLMAHALVAVCEGTVGGGGVDLTVAIDLHTLLSGVHDGTMLHASSGAELPVAAVRRLACEADIIPVVFGGEGEVLDLGRSRRLATRAQRRALRTVFPTCFVPGCDVAFDRCQVHHLRPFELGGRTDLHDLRPVCSAHHHRFHEGRWAVVWAGFQATITRPDGVTMDAGPPTARAG